jgi:L-threonylcarbamoyladenylate synthase
MKLLTLEEPRALERAVSAIQHGGVIAFPTDTVYGLGASLAHPPALKRIFDIKGRERSRTLPVLLASPGDLSRVSPAPDPQVLALARHFWPGPLTIAVPALDWLPEDVVANDGTVGVRVPDHSVALTIAHRCGGAIAATSANISGRPPACRAEDIDPDLAEQLDIVLDGGLAPCGLASTVIRREGATIFHIREGAVPARVIQSVWDDILAADSLSGGVTSRNTADHPAP